MGVVSTHSAAEVMELCRNKDLTYKVLQEAELPIPRHVCFNLADNNIAEQIATAQWQVNYPMFVKPTGGGNSIGIDEKSVINNAQELRTVLERLVNSYGITHALAESYLPGQEFTVGVMGHQEKYVLPILGFPANFPVRSNAVKKIEAEQRDKFQILYPTDSRYARLQHLALKTFEALGAKGVIRIDMKEDIDGNPYIIDVNGTPSLSAKGSLAFMSEHNGMTFRDLIGSVLKEQPLYQGVVEEDVLIV